MNSRAQIVATIGPKSGTPEMLPELIAAGIDLVRLNFSWGTHAEHAQYIANVRAASAQSGKHISIIQDLSGPRSQGESGHAFDPESTVIAGVLTQKDLNDLAFGIEQKVEYVALSYVSCAQDVTLLKEKIAALGGTAKVIAKIERQEALDNLKDIISVTDAVMIARGDLGQNIPIERLPFVQEDIVLLAKEAGKPVITATQMLLSMVANPEPTRAEVTDIAYAIILGSDAVMLSEETARGSYPVEAVTVMEKVIVEAERHLSATTTHLL